MEQYQQLEISTDARETDIATLKWKLRLSAERFNELRPGLEGFARAVTGKPKLRLRITWGASRTDGEDIFVQPPLILGKYTDHNRGMCERRNQYGESSCLKCTTGDLVLARLLHEISHIAGESFTPVKDGDRLWAIRRMIQSGTTFSHKSIAERVEQAIRNGEMWESISGIISPFMPGLVRIFEDIRVDHTMGKVRPGALRMRRVDLARRQRDGVSVIKSGSVTEGDREVIVQYGSMSLNSQLVVATYNASVDALVSYVFDSRVIDAIESPPMAGFIRTMREMKSPRDSFNAAYNFLEVARSLGFFQDPEDDELPSAGEDSEAEGKSSENDSFDPMDGSGESEATEQQESNKEDSSDPADGDSAESEESGEGEPEEEGGDASGGDSSMNSDPDHGTGEEGDSTDVPGEGESPNAENASGDASGAEFGEGDENQDGGDETEDSCNEDDGGESEGQEGQSGDEGDDGAPDDADGDPGSDDSADALEGDDDDPSTGEEGEAPESGAGSDGAGSSSQSGSSDETNEDSDDDFVDEGESESDGENSDDETDLREGGADDEAVDHQPERVFVEDVDWGSPEQVVNDFENLAHQSQANTDRVDDDIAKAMMREVARLDSQLMAFDGVRRSMTGLRVSTKSKHASDEQGRDVARAWTHRYPSRYGDYSKAELGIVGDFEPTPSDVRKVVSHVRPIFDANKRSKWERNARSGDVAGSMLARRIPFGDDRVFQKKRRPAKRSYAVGIGIDLSMSTAGINLVLLKQSALVLGDAMDALPGVKFAVWGHSAQYVMPDRAKTIPWDAALYTNMYEAKIWDEPWRGAARGSVESFGPDAENCDGHTLEFYRKRLMERRETDKILFYFTDGQMPYTNYEEEVEILRQNLKICRERGIEVIGVGINTDSPKDHGLDTVVVTGPSDVHLVAEKLEARLAS